MNLSHICFGRRFWIGLFALSGLGFYYTGFINNKMFTQQNENPISGLKVTLGHKKGSSPPTIVATVTNENPIPVSILSYNSPLDSLALQIGLLSITPFGADEPLDLPRLEATRVWPPAIEDIITISPGEAIENEIVLKPQVVPSEMLPERATYELKGEWQAVWNQDTENISETDLQDFPASKSTFSGRFTSGDVSIHI